MMKYTGRRDNDFTVYAYLCHVWVRLRRKLFCCVVVAVEQHLLGIAISVEGEEALQILTGAFDPQVLEDLFVRCRRALPFDPTHHIWAIEGDLPGGPETAVLGR